MTTTRTGRDAIRARAEANPIPHVVASAAKSQVLGDLVNTIAILGKEEAGLDAETARLYDVYSDAHEADGEHVSGDCPACKRPKIQALYRAYGDMHRRGDAVNKSRQDTYEKLLGAVLEILGEAGVEPPEDGAGMIASEGAVMAAVDAGKRTFLVLGSVEFVRHIDPCMPTGWGYATLAIL